MDRIFIRQVDDEAEAVRTQKITATCQQVEEIPNEFLKNFECAFQGALVYMLIRKLRLAKLLNLGLPGKAILKSLDLLSQEGSPSMVKLVKDSIKG